MITLQKLSLHSLKTLALFSLALIAGTGPLAFAQGSVRGKLSLPVEARLGNTMLPPGEYQFSVQLLGSVLSVDAIQNAYGPVAVLLVSTSKGGPVAGALATASRLDPRNPRANDLLPDGTGNKIHSITLENVGLVLQFFEGSNKNTLHARAAAPAQVVASAKASD
jgi:hypothetical protein